MTLNLASHRLSSLEGASSTVSCGSPHIHFELLIHIFTDGAWLHGAGSSRGLQACCICTGWDAVIGGKQAGEMI